MLNEIKIRPTGSINGSACEACPAEFFKVLEGNMPCTQCDPGAHTDGLTGQFSGSACMACPSNSVSPAGSATSADCVCARGYWLYAVGSEAFCEACPAGKYSPTVGATTDVCQKCSAGKYSPASGATS
jgi:hypothetical protein